MSHSAGIEQAKKLDKFYTKPDVVAVCVAMAAPYAEPDTLFIEPSAGAGAFLDHLPLDTLAFDIAPEDRRIIQCDFLGADRWRHLPDPPANDNRPRLIIGNPPFGGGPLALKFLNRSLELSPMVAFILPVSFQKWGLQRQVDGRAKLVLDADLNPNGFALAGRARRVHCCFQVWTHRNDVGPDRRLPLSAPPISHDDFTMHQVNNTEGATKWFAQPWDFAVRRQGGGLRPKLHLSVPPEQHKGHWMLLKAHSPDVLERLKALDYGAMSKGVTVRGFGKADLVRAYSAQLQQETQQTVGTRQSSKPKFFDDSCAVHFKQRPVREGSFFERWAA